MNAAQAIPEGAADDNDDVRVGAAIQRLLRAHWDVHVASSGRVAIVEADATFDVVLCDLMMPEMTGMDFHAELLRVQPALAERTVFMTGGTFTERAEEFLERVPNLRLDKPFDRQTLIDTLHSVAGAHGEPARTSTR